MERRRTSRRSGSVNSADPLSRASRPRILPASMGRRVEGGRDFQRASPGNRKGLWREPCFHPPTRSSVAFAQRLSAFPIVLEVVPPHRRASEKALAGLVTKVRSEEHTSELTSRHVLVC